MSSKKNILVVYGSTGAYPLRASVRDILFCFKKYSSENIYYHNASMSKLPKRFAHVKFDLIIFHVFFLSDRWTGGNLDFMRNIVLKNVSCLKKNASTKILLTQDEWFHSDLLNEIVIDFNIKKIFSVAPPSEWKTIFNKIDFNKVELYQVLTGYLDEEVLSKIKFLETEITNRDIDVSYRAYNAPAWLGSHGFLKTKIAEVFSLALKKNNFNVDISVNSKDTILGDDWYRFLLRSKYVLGVEGGATVIDRDGKIWENGRKYMKSNPNAQFNEIEKNVFAGKDGELKLLAISPRHLECCATKTCQVLIEGNYNGILKPGIHFIEVKKDFSNIEQVIMMMKDEKLRLQLIANAYRDVILTKNFTYENYVNYILNTTITEKSVNNLNIYNKFFFIVRERINWKLYTYRKTNKHNFISLIHTLIINIYISLGFRKIKSLFTKKV